MGPATEGTIAENYMSDGGTGESQRYSRRAGIRYPVCDCFTNITSRRPKARSSAERVD
jgi:hypothetical protein